MATKPMLSRADLLKAIHHTPSTPVEVLAKGLGFRTTDQESTPTDSPDSSEKSVENLLPFDEEEKEIDGKPEQLPSKRPAASFLRVAQSTRLDTERMEGENDPNKPPQWYRKAKEFNPNEVQSNPDITAPSGLALMKAPRIQAVLRQILSELSQSQRIDTDQLINKISQAEHIYTLPKLQHKQWVSNATLILDFNERLLPFWDDFTELGNKLQHMRGKTGLHCLKMCDDPLDEFEQWQQSFKSRKLKSRKPKPGKAWKIPAQGTPVIICSDLGIHDTSGRITELWLLFGHLLKQAGIRPIVFMPVQTAMTNVQLDVYYQQISWDHTTKPILGKQHISQYPKQESEDTKAIDNAVDNKESDNQQDTNEALEEDNKAVEKLLGLLSPASRIEPKLIRAARRQLLKPEENHVGIESLVWWHKDMIRGMEAAALNPEALKTHRDFFKKEASEAEQQTVITLLKHYHAHLHPSVLHEELLNCDALTDVDIPDIQHSYEFFQNTVKTLNEQAESTMMSWGLGLITRLGAENYQQSQELSTAWAVVNRQSLQEGKEVAIPEGIDQQKLKWLFGKTGEIQVYNLYQQANTLLITPAVASAESTPPPEKASMLGRFRADTAQIMIQLQQLDRPRLIPLQEETRIQLNNASSFILTSSIEQLEVDSIVKPSWATAIWRDQENLWVHSKEIAGNGVNLLWFNDGVTKQSYWRSQYQPAAFPWANKIGRDEVGFFADITINGIAVKDITQRMRWIPAGEFMMGSPEDEAERSNDETQHKVVISKGYWLADTACTQAFWQAVTRDNPAHFKENPENPVEQVSWEDIRDKFLPKLNGLLNELFNEPMVAEARLPSEAEWEYACRAGTITPFYFGENITTDQVNFDGNYPYKGAEKGQSRSKTVPVKSMNTPNSWGLHEMHGNIFEWCQDWFKPFTQNEQRDPVGPKSGKRRVMRGGSWFDYGRNARSAFRNFDSPDFRRNLIGFRFALGQPELKQEKQASQQERSKVRQMEPERNRSGLVERLTSRFKRK